MYEWLSNKILINKLNWSLYECYGSVIDKLISSYLLIWYKPHDVDLDIEADTFQYFII